MNRRLGILIVLILALAGCGRDASPPAAQSTSAAEASSSAVAQNPTGEGGNIPDPCTLLSDAEVTQLTGRDITQIDKDGADADCIDPLLPVAAVLGPARGVPVAQRRATTSRSPRRTHRRFRESATTPTGATATSMCLSAAHQIDVYARGGDEQQSQAEAEKVAAALTSEGASRSPDPAAHLERQADPPEDPGDVRQRRRWRQRRHHGGGANAGNCGGGAAGSAGSLR